MNFMTVADCHGKLTERELREHSGLAEGLPDILPDIVLFLGDNSTDDIECVQDYLKTKNINVPQLGVFGNHDSPYILQACGIKNIHRKVVTVNGLRIGGFGGAVRYKDTSEANLFTHEESMEQMSDLTECELFVTHSNPQYRDIRQVDVTPKPKNLIEKLKQVLQPSKAEYEFQLMPFKNDCHAGLVGIGDYIDSRKPKLHLYGHLHERTQEQRYATLSRCCYGIEMVSYEPQPQQLFGR